jgi:hypothetical protein
LIPIPCNIQTLCAITPYRSARLLRRVLALVFGAITLREVYGPENLPATGRCIPVFNHLIFTRVQRPDFVGLVAGSNRGSSLRRVRIGLTTPQGAGGGWSGSVVSSSRSWGGMTAAGDGR